MTSDSKTKAFYRIFCHKVEHVSDLAKVAEAIELAQAKILGLRLVPNLLNTGEITAVTEDEVLFRTKFQDGTSNCYVVSRTSEEEEEPHVPVSEVKDQILNMSAAGKSVSTIASELDLTYQQVYQVVRRTSHKRHVA